MFPFTFAQALQEVLDGEVSNDAFLCRLVGLSRIEGRGSRRLKLDFGRALCMTGVKCHHVGRCFFKKVGGEVLTRAPSRAG